MPLREAADKSVQRQPQLLLGDKDKAQKKEVRQQQMGKRPPWK
jgi:hypothetical protein